MGNLEVGDIVLCTVDRIVGTVVFVKLEDGKEGNIILSEIAPGRIRNLRDYVVPKKKIVCKIIRLSQDRIDLSLRRVTQKEQKEIRELHEQERSYRNIFKTILGEQSERTIEKITEEKDLSEFIEESKKNSKELEKIVGKDNSKKILEILNSQKKKKAVLKKEFFLTTIKPDGVEKIKKILGEVKDAEIKYISAGRYSIRIEDDNIKKADNKIKKIILDIEEKAKKENMEFEVKEK